MSQVNDPDAKYIDAVERYLKAFPDAVILRPAMVGQDEVADAMLDAIAKGRRIPDDYDWYKDLPPGALA